MAKVTIKSKEELETMIDGGKRLSRIKHALMEMLKPGMTSFEVEQKAVELIKKEGGEASFKKVPGYSWATCVNVNSGIVHGIPKKEVIFKDGDIVSVDVGIFYKGLHTDTASTKLLGNDSEKDKFLEVGRRALNLAIKEAKIGKKIDNISAAIGETIRSAGFEPVYSLTGHGVGRTLHEDPQIPCFVTGNPVGQTEIKEGMTLAIEVMYTEGSPDLTIEEDGWTIGTKDGKISALFEETVAVTKDGPIVLTK